jgi:uncharacterized membrane protein (Fun14 family)
MKIVIKEKIMDQLIQPAAVTTTQPGWIEQLAQKINADTFFRKFNLTTAQVIEIITFFIGGIAAGFLAKRYFKHVIIAIVLLVVLLKGMEHFGITTVVFNWARMKELTGVGPRDTVSDIVHTYAYWLKTHIPVTIGVVVGFLLGLKIG